MSTDEYIKWAQQQESAGRRDPMGYPWTSWLVARRNLDGTVMRDQHNRQVFETQAEYLARVGCRPGTNVPLQGDLFAEAA